MAQLYKPHIFQYCPVDNFGVAALKTTSIEAVCYRLPWWELIYGRSYLKWLTTTSKYCITVAKPIRLKALRKRAVHSWAAWKQLNNGFAGPPLIYCPREPVNSTGPLPTKTDYVNSKLNCSRQNHLMVLASSVRETFLVKCRPRPLPTQPKLTIKTLESSIDKSANGVTSIGHGTLFVWVDLNKVYQFNILKGLPKSFPMVINIWNF